ncbi:MAG TPA: hypothetical protein H9836_14045, partial [Candidatus Nocardiopsis merdipullorum]|nr:hypothetical protein [Candidatus Nocardiopsis merdipullorum]
MRNSPRATGRRPWAFRGLAAAAGIGVAASLALAVTSPSAAQERVDNPYQGADVYVNPVWSANAAAEPGGQAIAD